MSLRDAVAEIADDLDKDAKQYAMRGDGILVSLLSSYAKQLRRALKASEGEQQVTQQIITPQVQHDHMINKFREEFRKQKSEKGESVPVMREERDKAELEEVHDGIQVHVSGGPDDDCWVQIDPRMPIGAKTMLAGGVYVLNRMKDGGHLYLEFSPEETAKIDKR